MSDSESELEIDYEELDRPKEPAKKKKGKKSGMTLDEVLRQGQIMVDDNGPRELSDPQSCKWYDNGVAMSKAQ